MQKSPLTNSTEVTLITQLNKGRVIYQYKKEFGIDVSRFFLNQNTIDIYTCDQTQLRFYSHYETAAADGEFYNELGKNNSNYYYEDKWEFTVADFMKPTDSILEIGSGSGNFLSYLKKKNIENARGLELSSEATKASIAKGFNVVNTTIHDFSKTKPELFDVICSFQVFEHLPNIDSTIRECLALLKPNGLFIISVPDNDASVFSMDPYHTLNLPPHHVILWDEASLKSLCKMYNLELVTILKSPAGSGVNSVKIKNLILRILGYTFGFNIFLLIKRLIKLMMPASDGGATIIGVYRKK